MQKTLKQRKRFKRGRLILQLISKYVELRHLVGKNGKISNAGSSKSVQYLTLPHFFVRCRHIIRYACLLKILFIFRSVFKVST